MKSKKNRRDYNHEFSKNTLQFKKPKIKVSYKRNSSITKEAELRRINKSNILGKNQSELNNSSSFVGNEDIKRNNINNIKELFNDSIINESKCSIEPELKQSKIRKNDK